ncbi:hypothetical protein [Paenibacillus medicaginis]|uniref:Uncharacterized protein n=1 Tax=Paenibacillus medicaginis TaxID=1470560 RepID=A0ABV5C3B2_9BACL
MSTWARNGYEVAETAFNYDLHLFLVVQNGETLYEIVPSNLDNQADIINELSAGADINGWEDGMGNTISIQPA